MSENPLEIAIASIAACLYEDSKKTINSFTSKTFAPKQLKEYLSRECEHYKFIKNMLFGTNRIEFDETYEKHRLEIDRLIIKEYTIESLFSKYPQISLSFLRCKFKLFQKTYWH